jgi:hypothetical protein
MRYFDLKLLGIFFQDAVKIMAKDLVRTRRYIKKFILMRANIQAVSLKIQTLKSQNSMAQAMKGVTKAMQTMNKQVSVILINNKSFLYLFNLRIQQPTSSTQIFSKSNGWMGKYLKKYHSY